MSVRVSTNLVSNEECKTSDQELLLTAYDDEIEKCWALHVDEVDENVREASTARSLKLRQIVTFVTRIVHIFRIRPELFPQFDFPVEGSRHKLSPHGYLHYTLSAAFRVVVFLLPSFISVHMTAASTQLNAPQTGKQVMIHSTAYLDGVRGVAAILVFFYHMSYSLWDGEVGYGVDSHYGIFRLPIISMIHGGGGAIGIFFVVSGFTLTIRPLKHIRARQPEALLACLGSSMLRRPIRLFLPCVASTLLVLFFSQIGFFEATRWYWERADVFPGYNGSREGHVTAKDSISEDIWRWMHESAVFLNFFDWEALAFLRSYDRHLWTIPIEFRGSIALLSSLLAMSRLRPSVRMIVTVILAVWALLLDRWEMVLFWGGSFLAELNMTLEPYLVEFCSNPMLVSSDPHNTNKWHRCCSSSTRKLLFNTFFTINFISSLYLLSYPSRRAEESWGFMYLSSLIPPSISLGWRFWGGIGGLQAIFCISNAPFLGRFFSSSILRYLGQISFSLYLVHGMVLHLVGFPLFWVIFTALGHPSGDIMVAVGFLAGAASLTLLTCWWADIFARAVEVPCIKLGRWVEERCVSK